MKARSIILILIAITLLLVTTQCSSKSSTGPTPTKGLDGSALVQERCTVCHSIERIQQAHKTADEWKTTVERMIGHGATLNADEKAAVIDYLAATYK